MLRNSRIKQIALAKKEILNKALTMITNDARRYYVVANLRSHSVYQQQALITRRLARFNDAVRERKQSALTLSRLHVLTSANARTYVRTDRVFSYHGTAINRTEIVGRRDFICGRDFNIYLSISLSLSLSLSCSLSPRKGGENGLG